MIPVAAALPNTGEPGKDTPRGRRIGIIATSGTASPVDRSTADGALSSRPVSAPAEVEIRTATSADHAAIVDLAGAALGWRPDEPNVELFRWKHLENPFGASPMWVASVGGELAAFRCFLRWEFETAGAVRRAVRPVDTATHPGFQGRGLFTELTRHGLGEVGAEGVDFVFNTPNAQSRPGYLKMGWQVIGRVPVAVTVTSPASLGRLARARVAAGKWSLPTPAGHAVADVLADRAGVEALLASQPPSLVMSTRRSLSFLSWRYGGGPLAYRAALRTDRVEDGMALYRLRRRGRAIEATIGDVIVPDADRRLDRELVARVGREARPDYLIRVQSAAIAGRSVRFPGQGPLLTWRALAQTVAPAMADFGLRLGDIESL